MSAAPGQALPVVLVIDDNPDDRLKIRWMLSRERPVAFHEAEGAVQGLALWARIKPDLVLLDLSMPDGRGEEVLRLARQQRWGDPLVIAVSELALPDRVSSLAQEGVKGFLPKDRLTQDLLSHSIEQVTERVRVRGRIVDQQARLDLACQQLAKAVDDCGVAYAELGQSVSEQDPPPIRLLKRSLQRGSQAMSELATELSDYASTQPMSPSGQCTWGDARSALTDLLSDRLEVRGQLDEATPLGVDAAELVNLIQALVEHIPPQEPRRSATVSVDVESQAPNLVVSIPHLAHEIAALWPMKTPDSEPGERRLSQGLGTLIKRVRGSQIQLAVSQDPKNGFCLVVRLPNGASTPSKA